MKYKPEWATYFVRVTKPNRRNCIKSWQSYSRYMQKKFLKWRGEKMMNLFMNDFVNSEVVGLTPCGSGLVLQVKK